MTETTEGTMELAGTTVDATAAPTVGLLSVASSVGALFLIIVVGAESFSSLLKDDFGAKYKEWPAWFI